MCIYLQYSESSVLKNACKNARPQKDSLGIFHPSRIEVAYGSKRRVDGSLAKTLLLVEQVHQDWYYWVSQKKQKYGVAN